MNKYLKGFLIGLIFSFLVFSFTVLAATDLISIDVLFNSINIEIDEKDVELENILYNNKTYVPLRDINYILENDIYYDEERRTAVIKTESNNKLPNIKTGNDLKLYLSDIEFDLRTWENQFKTKGYNKKEFDEYTLYTISLGQRNTGGYSIEIENIYISKDNILKIEYNEITPNPEHMVTQAITYPTKSILIENKDLEIEFNKKATK